MSMSADAYQAELKRMTGSSIPGGMLPPIQTGPFVDSPKTYPGKFGSSQGTPGTPVETATVPQRIADVAKKLTEAGHELQAAREQYGEALLRKAQWERMFSELAGAMTELTNEHRGELER